jgi:carboxymethylenebutenolidase
MIEDTLDLETSSGAMETFVCRPERGGPFPAVLFLMDAPGIREELRDMVRRLATVGYYVLLPNLYYRAGRDTMYGPDVLEKGSAENERMRAVRTKMTIPPVMDDVADMLAFVDRQSDVRRRVLHERALCPGGCRAFFRSYRRRRLDSRYLARQRRRGKPASFVCEDDG